MFKVVFVTTVCTKPLSFERGFCCGPLNPPKRAANSRIFFAEIRRKFRLLDYDIYLSIQENMIIHFPIPNSQFNVVYTYPVSSIQYPVSSIQYPVSSIQPIQPIYLIHHLLPSKAQSKSSFGGFRGPNNISPLFLL